MNRLWNKTRSRSCVRHLVLFICLILLFACGSGSDTSEEVSSDTGSINFGLKWETPASNPAKISSLGPSGDVCADYDIDTINATIYNASNTQVASASWPCDAHQGTISDVPTGSGRRLMVEAVVSGTVLWQGEILGITVSSGTNNVGPVTMTYIGNDTTPPTVVSTNPIDGATGVALDITITATFSEDVGPAPASGTGSFTLATGGTSVSGTVTYNDTTWTATFTPDSILSPTTTYTATIAANVDDKAGNAMGADYIWSFTTTALSDLTVTKQDDSDPVTAGNRLTYAITVSNGGPSAAGNVSIDDTLPIEIQGAEYSTDNGANWDSWTGSLSLGTFNSGVSQEVLIRGVVDVSTSGTITNEASVSSDAVDPDTGNNIASESTQVEDVLTVLIAPSDNTSNATTLQSELRQMGIHTVDLMSVRDYTPTLAELQPYDVVISWVNNAYYDKVAMGDVLADYVDDGGGVVLGNFVWYGPTFDLAGRIQDVGYSPFEQVGPSLYTTACLGTNDPGHPLMQGVTAACDDYRDDVIVESGATLVASWDDGQPFIAVNADVNVVGITSWPANSGPFTGDVPRVFYNAVIYTAQAAGELLCGGTRHDLATPDFHDTTGGEGQGRAIGFQADANFNISSVGIMGDLPRIFFDVVIYDSPDGHSAGTVLYTKSYLTGGTGYGWNDIPVSFPFIAGKFYVLNWRPSYSQDWANEIDYYNDSGLPFTVGPLTILEGFEGYDADNPANYLHPHLRLCEVEEGGLYFSRDSDSNGLYFLDIKTGQAIPLGITGVNSGNVGLAYDPLVDLLYGSKWSTLLHISRDGSGFVDVGGQGTEGLAYDHIRDVLYGTINNTFFIVDKSDGSIIADLAAPGFDAEGLAVNPITGIVYAVGDDTILNSYDPDTDQWTTVGDTGLNWDSGGLAYNAEQHVLYACGTNQGTFLYKIDPDTAVADVIGDSGVQLTGGLAYAAGF